ncbi:nuclear transport factor 2 family protein [Bradyrhizobium sp. JYMT SZCCT0180]|uniref:nuclear transport factor 2 family protein n=1 Tax=Bradyrhizobium sp. JYMT SZCCT0180 TaxID=2807666 RepID=UPI0020136BCA|nr:nuclear transport factor 2 family protein [Bradyrhizobium sp. JYMT SZCCT0180]
MSKMDRRAFLGRSASVTFGATLVSAPGLMLTDPTISYAQSPPVPNNNPIDNKLMDADAHALRSLAQTYFDGAYEMDADKFASIFHPSSSVTKVGDDGNVSVTPIATWLAAVRNLKAPKQQGLERQDQILSIDVEGELALVKLKLQIPPRYFTDLLSCLKVNGTWKIAQKVMTSKI